HRVARAQARRQHRRRALRQLAAAAGRGTRRLLRLPRAPGGHRRVRAAARAGLLPIPEAVMTGLPGPLTGVRVLAFEHAWAAPYGTMMLADMGADVVKVEPPGLGDHVRAWTRNDLHGLSPHFLAVNRNKR